MIKKYHKKFSLVIPCYCEGRAIIDNLSRFHKHLSLEFEKGVFEIIAVNDGSPDDTHQQLIKAQSQLSNVRIIHYDRNRGKGYAVKQGVLEAKGEYIGYIDADGEISADHLHPYLTWAERGNDIVIGSKTHPGSNAQFSRLRKILSSGYRMINKVLFRLEVADTQVGIKIFNRKVGRKIFPLIKTEGYAFDVEFLSLAKYFNFSILEAPVSIKHSNENSSIRILGILKFFYETLRIRLGVHKSFWVVQYAPSFYRHAKTFSDRKTMPHKKLHLLFLSWRDIDNPKAGGAEVFTHEVLKRLAQAGHTIDHISPKFPKAEKEKFIDGVRYLRYGNLLTSVWFARRWIRNSSHQYDLVIDQCNTHHFLSPLWLPKKQKHALFIHQLTREIWFQNARFPINLFGYIAEPLLLQLHRGSSVLTVSESTKKGLEDFGFKAKGIHILPEGLNFTPWDMTEWEKKEDKFTALYLGRFVKYKGVEDAILGFAHFHQQFPNSQLWLVGKVPTKYQSKLQKLIDEHNISEVVKFWGFVDEDQKLKLMSRSHVIMVPSKREGWGLIVTEANAVGTIAIVYDSPGLRDSVRHHQTGIICEQNTPEGLFMGLQTLHGSPQFYQILRVQAHQWSQVFHWDITAQEMEHVIQQVVSPTSPGQKIKKSKHKKIKAHMKN